MSSPISVTPAIRAGLDSDQQFGSVVPPLYLSTNFTFRELGSPREFDYTRSGNPTRACLADAIAHLEGGAGATITATGMGAITLVLLAQLQPGDRVAYPHDCYGGSWRLFEELRARHHFEFFPVDFTAPNVHEELGHIRPKLVWIESPSNPLLRITDIRTVSATAKRLGATVVVDNTFLTPLGQLPLALGADVVVHSVTKYLNGHSDVVQGAVIAKTVRLAEQLDYWANVLGLTASPIDSHLVLRGLRTLELRFARHQANAQQLVDAIASHPAIAKMHFPGLSTHPEHSLAQSQQHGFGAVFSIELRGGEAAVQAFTQGLQLFSLAESLGGTESLVAHPATMTHASMTPEAQATAGITPGLLRFSVGIDPVHELIADVRNGLARADEVVAAV
ncbi:cystathionine gamma-synthase [Gulosibacter bifidus]|uniref:Cystathionine gamma-synthase n=1 Tax=Gulosibacter bifidus TaxID=272239 RepID=A0ABW5RGX9_9MICO|nr:cystathionine gamma-synthase [Gulosibacter bifidus]